METGSEQGDDDLPSTPRWLRGLRRVWPVVRVALIVLQLGATARHHEDLALTVQVLVALGSTAADTFAGGSR